MPTDREQKLVDIIFQVAYNVHHYGKHMTDEERNVWISKQLCVLGYPGKPIGLSWHVLDKK